MSLLVILSALVAPSALAGQGEGAAGGGGAADTMSTAAADERAQAAVAAVLVATLGERFHEPMLEVRLGQAGIESIGPREQVVSGSGQLRFDGDDDGWFSFAYRSLYDPVHGGAGYPEVELGGDEGGGERFVPNDARLVAELETRLVDEFESWPGAGRVFLQFDDISSLQTGERFLLIEASGLADFGSGGRTPARVEALYDLQARAWRSIEHTLEPNVSPREGSGTAGW